MSKPLILYVPGMNPKPPPDLHRAYLWRAVLEGVRRAQGSEEELARACEFHICAWNVFFYAQTRRVAHDIADIERALRATGANARDRSEAHDWRRVFFRWFYTLADHLPWVIPMLPNQTLQATIAGTHRYFANYLGIADEVREALKKPLRAALLENRPVLIIGHSLGTVIAFDALWELTWREKLGGKVDFISLGSPLGMRFVQNRLLGHSANGEERYTRLLRRWDNIVAVGDLAALDTTVRDDFRFMLKHRMLEDIVDHDGGIYNHFREDGVLNVHRSYGYLVHAVTGSVVNRWWRRAYLPQSHAAEVLLVPEC